MINKVILLGFLGDDMKTISFENGNIYKASLATTEKWKDREGNPKEETTWHNLVIWPKTAQAIGQYLTKGSQIYVEGKIRQRSWEKDGQKHYLTEVSVMNLQIIKSTYQQSQPQGSTGSDYDPGFDPNEPDDLPF